jgi:autotransporter-associated beta strand protein
MATTAMALLAAMPAHAQDATWGSFPFTSLFSDPNNWTTGTVPTGTAFFGATTVADLTVPVPTVVGGWTFNAGSPAYTFLVGPSAPLTFNGAGIVINAGSATITNQGASAVTFSGTSTAGSAIININQGGSANAVTFSGTSTAGNASINNQGSLFFVNDATAGNATITNNMGAIVFRDSSKGNNATIRNQAGSVTFLELASAENASIVNSGDITFGASSTAGNATITNNFDVVFQNESTAGSATVHTTNRGGTQFFQNASGGLARFITDAGGNFDISSAAGPVTVGSIEGAGFYFLGANQLTTGGNNLSTTVSGMIQGPGGSLVKTGSGTLTLSGLNIYTGPTTVNAGALIVDGSISQSSLTTVNSGATVGGSGTVGSTIINAGGSFAPGPAGAPGTMTVDGNLAFQSGALYVVQIIPANNSTTNVSGTASLAGTVHANFAPGTYFTNRFTILTAAGGRTGTFDALATSGLPAGFRASLSYTGNTAVLNLLAQLVPTLGQPSVPGQSPPPTFTVNHIKVGSAIENFFNNGGTLPPAFVPLFGLTGSNLTSGLDQLHGEAATGAQKVGFQLTDQFLNLMLDPFVDGRSGVGGADHPALGFASQRETMPREIALAYASVLKAPPKAVPVYEPRWTVWGGAYGGSNRTSGDLAVIGSHDLSARTVGVAGGFDYRLTPDTLVGLAFAGGGTDWSLSQGLGGGKSDAFQAGIYGATKSGPAYLAAAFAFANHWMSTDRFAFAGNHLTADFNAQSYGGRLEGGYRFGTPYGGIAPYAAIQAQSFRTPDFSEVDVNNGGFALAFNGRTATDTRSELGGRFDRVLAVYSNAVLALRGRLAWAHDWVSDATLTPVFQSLPGASFIVNGALPEGLRACLGRRRASPRQRRHAARQVRRRVRLALDDLRRHRDHPLPVVSWLRRKWSRVGPAAAEYHFANSKSDNTEV